MGPVYQLILSHETDDILKFYLRTNGAPSRPARMRQLISGEDVFVEQRTPTAVMGQMWRNDYCSLVAPSHNPTGCHSWDRRTGSKIILIRNAVMIRYEHHPAAGTGSFLDQQAAGLISSGFCDITLQSRNPSDCRRCTVFESDMIHKRLDTL